MKNRILLAWVLLLTLLVASDAALAAPPPQGFRPGLSGTGAMDAGILTQIEWSADGKYVEFTNWGNRYRFDLRRKTCETVEVKKKEKKDAGGKEKKRPSRGERRRRGEGKEEGKGEGELRRIPRPGRGRQYMTERSPDGKWYAVCKEWNVALENDETGEAIQVTKEGHRKFRYGTANWMYGEELNERHGMWWSPDSKKLVFYEFDERPVKDYYLTRDLTKYNTSLYTEGYTKAGDPNPIVSLIIYDLESGKCTPVDTGAEDQYLYGMRFTPDGSELLYHRTDRRQKRLDIMALNFDTAETRVVVQETQDTWQDNAPYMRFLEDGKRFIWETEKTGWKQYELRDLDGSLVCTLTKGDYPATGIVKIDEEKGFIYYTAYSDKHPLCLQLHRVRLDGTRQKRLTALSFNHSRFDLSPDRKWFIVRYEDVETPPSTALFSTEGKLVSTLAEGPKLESHLSELFSYQAADGVTVLYGVLYKPEGFDPKKQYPLMVSVYGGPGSRAIRNTFRRQGHPTTKRGYLVARFDNRGTGGRGKAFMGAVYEKLGDVDIRDQADGVRYLRKRPYVDGNRVGIYGVSYGGFMAAMGVLRHPDVFHAASVGSGVTDWRQYDSIYTERYMNLPQDNPEGYRAGSCTPYMDQFKGKMLIMHGMLDDNVHPNNAWELIDALDKAKKKYESRFFPRAGHGVPGSDTMWEFFRRHLIASHEAEAAGKSSVETGS